MITIKGRDTLKLVQGDGSVRIENGSVLKLISGGPMGMTGPPGDPALSSFRSADFPLLQVWLAVHNLGYEPAGIQAYELVAPGVYVEVKGKITHLSVNAFTIMYDVPIAGYVLAS